MTKLNKGTENKFYIGLIITISILFIVFFTSKMWLYDDSPIMQTPFNSNISGLDQTTLRLNKWEYNPEKELMEVSLETIHSGSDVVKPTFTFLARERDSLEEYPVKIVYKDDSDIVIQIENVPETYRVIGLIVYEHRDRKILENEAREVLETNEGSISQDDNNEFEFTLPKPAEKVIVGDYRQIKVNPNLETKSASEYQIESIQREIADVEKQISVINEHDIPLQNDLIESLSDEIKSLKDDLQYQTSEEQQETEREISYKQTSIENAEDEIEELKGIIVKLVEKREKLFERLEAIQIENDEIKTSKKNEDLGESQKENDSGDDEKNKKNDIDKKEKSKKSGKGSKESKTKNSKKGD